MKAEYEVGMRSPNIRMGGKPILGYSDGDRGDSFVDPIERPSVLLSTVCASTSGMGNDDGHGVAMSGYGVPGNGSFNMEESSVDICCAKLCLPDGRRVAAGCSDASLRIWSLESMIDSTDDVISGDGIETENEGGGGKGVKDNSNNPWATPHESATVLLGHKGGFPIFDVDWNRDGRTLFSAGGDGTVRLWDSMAVGPFGKLANVVRRTVPATHHAGGTKSTRLSSSGAPQPSAPQIPSPSSAYPSTYPNTNVPGARAEPMVEKSGAALACYRGHGPSTPVYSVSVSPSGYYFASSGADRSARLWCTDRGTPVRIFIGHLSSNVNCVTWHPNCNYILTGGDDRTVRMWDVQTGRCVRLLSGGRFGVNCVEVSPSGQYAAGADYGGMVHIWDLRNGRRVNELPCGFNPNHYRSPSSSIIEETSSSSATMIHSMSYSPCGSTIATGGDNCTVQIWDARGIGNNNTNPDYALTQDWASRDHSGGSSSMSYYPNDGGGGKNIETSTPSFNEQKRINKFGTKEPVKAFRTMRTILLDLKYTKRNLLLGVGKYSASGPLWSVENQ